MASWFGVVSEYCVNLDQESRKRYIEKLKKYDIRVDPLWKPSKKSVAGQNASSSSRPQEAGCTWSSDKKTFPPVTYPDIYNYLVDCSSPYTKEDLKAYKSLQGYRYLTAGYVHSVESQLLGGDVSRSNELLKNQKIVIRGKVYHGQKQNAPPLEPWVLVETDGSVCTAHCTCMAGLGEACSHVAAMLFFLMACREEQEGIACTSIPCSWAAPGGRTALAKPIKDIRFNSGSAAKRQKSSNPPSKEEQEAFMEGLKGTCPDAAALRIPPDYQPPPAPALPPLLSRLYDPALVGVPREVLERRAEEVLEDMVCTKEESTNAAHLTKKQSRCLLWYKLRGGRVTASRFKSVVTSNLDSPSKSVVHSTCSTEPSPIRAPAVLWGRQKERVALSEYRNVMGQKHTNLRVTKSGLVVSTEVPYLAASPDSLVRCDCCGEGVVEVKCPFTFRDSPLDSFLDDPSTCVVVGHDGQPMLKAAHEYHFQVQLQMFVCDVQYCDFVVYGNQFMLIIRVSRDLAFMHRHLEKVKAFMVKVALPQMMSKVFTKQ